MSPTARGRDIQYDRSRLLRRSHSRDDSMDRSRIARRRISMSSQKGSLDRFNGYSKDNEDYVDRSKRGYTHERDGRRRPDDRGRYGSSPRCDGSLGRNESTDRPPPPKRKERSLSPFSKRLALTQAMNVS